MLIKIIQKKRGLFFGLTILPVIMMLIYLWSFPETYGVSLNLHITRKGMISSNEYQYDDFYRLQADEKFADTLVEWLRNPKIVSDIKEGAGWDTQNESIRSLAGFLSPEKRSSQLVVVGFSAKNQSSGERLSQSLVKAITDRIEQLNKDQKEGDWFEIMAEAPLERKFEWPFWPMMLASLVGGLFLAILGVLIKHYFEE